ncbi:hypothetical protein [Zooshikella harenae]|uniref:Uncharacterized protein n=1 Tax=Zooshikella harenae TaxID=2827238 RepID=A0ABS5Z8K3_9GAMM|nr:hypothetical protein [Zooshikella harenae]MBU2709636.1 hypothetical protein [Zooshikella harenae]
MAKNGKTNIRTKQKKMLTISTQSKLNNTKKPFKEKIQTKNSPTPNLKSNIIHFDTLFILIKYKKNTPLIQLAAA